MLCGLLVDTLWAHPLLSCARLGPRLGLPAMGRGQCVLAALCRNNPETARGSSTPACSPPAHQAPPWPSGPVLNQLIDTPSLANQHPPAVPNSNPVCCRAPTRACTRGASASWCGWARRVPPRRTVPRPPRTARSRPSRCAASTAPRTSPRSWPIRPPPTTRWVEVDIVWGGCLEWACRKSGRAGEKWVSLGGQAGSAGSGELEH